MSRKHIPEHIPPEKVASTRFAATLMGLFITMASLFGSVSITNNLLLALSGSILSGVFAFMMMELALREKDDSKAAWIGGRTLSLLLLVAIAVCFGCAMKSLWYGIITTGGWGNRFIYENTAVAAGFVALVCTMALSALQKDVFSVNMLSRASVDHMGLDERQIKERQHVFETSYKLGMLILFAGLWFFANTIHNIPTILANYHGVPGHLMILPASFVLLLFSLPLIIAAWKKR